MEIIDTSDIQKEPKSPKKKSLPGKNYATQAKRIEVIQSAEQASEVLDFIERKGLEDSMEMRARLAKLLEERRFFDASFSLQDFTDDEINKLQERGSLKEHERAWKTKRVEAKTVENLVDQWKTEGFSNYEVLQKLLVAHQRGEVTLLAEKYANFQGFFSILQSNQFGVADTKRIVEVINQRNIDLTAPEAFEQIIFSIYEDDGVSHLVKEKICQKFKLFPISTGDDLRQNLKIKQQQVKVLERNRRSVAESLDVLATESTGIRQQLSELKQAILTESDLDKKLRLEKQYDALEERLNILEKEREDQEVRAWELNRQNVDAKVWLRGASADLRADEIVVTIPGTQAKVAVPKYLSSAAIAKAVNAYLVNDCLKTYGLESYFFYQSDFLEGGFPYPESMDRNDLFLFRLGFASDQQILTQSNLKRLKGLLTRLMKPKAYRIDLTLKENAINRLEEFGLMSEKTLNHEKMTNRLKELKELG